MSTRLTDDCLDNSDIDDSDDDEETQDLSKLVEQTHILSCETQIVPERNFILHLASTEDPNPKVAIATANKTCTIFQSTTSELEPIKTFSPHQNVVTQIKIGRENNNLFYTSSLDGTVKIWDLRESGEWKATKVIEETATSTKRKAFSCFDLSKNDQLVSIGTELMAGDAFVLFYDVRCEKFLGAYWESHTDDITQVKFQHNNSDMLASASTDGLINVYDISMDNETDALQNCFNTESSVDKINWCVLDKQTALNCVTHTFDVKAWRMDDGEPYLNFNRTRLAGSLQRKSSDDTFVSNIHQDDESLLIVTYGGNGSQKNDLCLLRVDNERKLTPYSLLLGNKQIVRCSNYSEKNKWLLTAGEGGIVNVWRPASENIVQNEISTNLKVKSNKLRDTRERVKPY